MSNNQYGHYAGGVNFATYYVAARNAVKDDWPELEIISGGSLSHHNSLAYTDQTPEFPAGTGMWAKSFLCGFIDKVTQEALDDGKGTYDYLPETIAIHAYTGQYAPEGNTIDQNNEWPDRLADLANVCTERGYFPNLSVTEYGFSPRHATQAYQNPWAPVVKDNSPQASETTQAVYYLRSCLMNATMKVSGVNWKESLYFHHCREAGSWLTGDGVRIGDWAFHDFDNHPGSSRAVRYVAREIFCTTGTRPGLHQGATIWSPLQTEAGVLERTGWCGWKRSDNELWGAIWRYRHKDWYWQPASGDDRDFVVDGEYDQYYANRYRFSISDGSATFQSVGTPISGAYSNGKTTWSIPDVDENPTFLWFDY